MISIGIPVFNRNVVPLILELKKQMTLVEPAPQLIIVDDASTEIELARQNRKAALASGASYFSLEKNLGRTAVRKLFAQYTRFSYLLLIDNDCFPVNENFLQTYIASVSQNSVLCGGLRYRDDADSEGCRLHYRYGRERETAASVSRLLSSNFCIPVPALESLPDADLPEPYGHEDTWMEIMLKRSGYKIVPLPNPVYHDGLKPDQVFMEHQEMAVKNLLFLYGRKDLRKELLSISSLVNFFHRVRMLGLGKMLAKVNPKSMRFFQKKILDERASLRWLDVYKLCLIARWLYAGEKR